MSADAAPTTVIDPRHPKRRRGLRVHELDGEAVLFDPVTGDTHRLNETAYFIWRQCDGRRNAQSIAERLSEAYDVSIEKGAPHVARMLTELRSKALVMDSGMPDDAV